MLPEVGAKGIVGVGEGGTIDGVVEEDDAGRLAGEDVEDGLRATPDIAEDVKAELPDALVERAADVTLRSPRAVVEEEEVARINDAVELAPTSSAVSEA